MKSECGTVPKSLLWNTLSGTLQQSGTSDKEKRKKCTLSKSGIWMPKIIEPTSSSSNIEKVDSKNIKISSKISEMRKLFEENLKQDISPRSDKPIQPNCEEPIRDEIEMLNTVQTNSARGGGGQISEREIPSQVKQNSDEMKYY